jgi:hypothetical protein
MDKKFMDKEFMGYIHVRNLRVKKNIGKIIFFFLHMNIYIDIYWKDSICFPYIEIYI